MKALKQIQSFTKSDQFAAVLGLEEMGRTLAIENHPGFNRDLSFCMSRNPAMAQRYIKRVEHKLTLLGMRTALEQRIPTWPWVDAQHMTVLGKETISQRLLAMNMDELTRGVMLICGSSYGEMLEFIGHLIAQLKQRGI